MATPSWQRDLADARRDPAQLACELGLDPAPIVAAAADFELRVTRHYLSLADPTDPNDPILAQILPAAAELVPVDGFGADPVGDQEHLRAPGLVVKHPGQALVVVTGACAVNCRYCFRRAFPYSDARGTDAAVDAIAADPTLTEVILSGGDPLSLSDVALGRLLDRLDAIGHVRRVRIHSRLPVVLPSRVTAELLDTLSRRRVQLWVVTHFNHPRELASEALDACRALMGQGIPVLNQSVLLAGINDDEDVLEALMNGLLDAGVKPYYLHQLDRVAGAAHFEVPTERGLALHDALRRRVSGLGLPAYVRDEPGRPSKVPIAPALLLATLVAGCGTPAPAPEPTTEPVRTGLSGVTADDVKPTPRPAPPVGTPHAAPLSLEGAKPLATIDRVLAADLDGDGSAELFQSSGAEVRWGPWPKSQGQPLQAHRYVGPGLLQAWTAVDAGEGRQEVWAAFGMGRGFPDAPLTVVVIDEFGGQARVSPRFASRGERNQATALLPGPKGVYIASFSSRFVVDGGFAPSDAKALPAPLPAHRLRMGMARAVGDFDGDGTPDVAIGRLYGADADTDGDLRAIVGGKSEAIPTVRGVRAVAAADLDGDGRDEVLFGDGWHKNYGKFGRFRPTIARRGADGTWTTTLLEERQDQYAVEQIAWDGRRLLAAGPRQLRVYELVEGAWTAVGEPVPAGPLGSFAVLEPGRYAVAGPRVGSVVR